MPDDEQKHDKDKPVEGGGGEVPETPETPAEATEAQEPGDAFRPEAIAARVEGMGEETDIDRIAREEEKKLQERRKGKKGKKGLEAAASKRLAKIGEVKVKRPSALTEGIPSDGDAWAEPMARARKWIRENRQTFGGLVAIAVLAGGGFLGWTYWQGKHAADASAMLSEAIADEHGHISDKEDDDDTRKSSALYPTFKSLSDRQQAALARYREVESKFAGTGAAILARLSEGSLLLDLGDAKGAIAAYEEVKASPLAMADAQVRARAIEGVGFADELLAKTDEAGKDKHLDDALAAFKQLETVDAAHANGFKELGKYHQARVLQAKGDTAKAIELLKDVHAAVSEPGETHPFPYLETVVEDRLRQLDPTALPPKAAAPKYGPGGPGGGGPGGGGNPDMNDPRIQELIKQLQQQAQQKGDVPPGPAPAPSP